ncbi:MAG: Sialic acid-binding periplasmic protein SiaP precursor [Smithella sp. PtaU1.Bin162]|nr:MAG: Sialic acid-binding periplasmic protein SiaP precursor [Smithella sp. PtaU1.Bin162]
MKKRIALSGLLIMTVLLGIMFVSLPAEVSAQEVITIKVADGLPSGHIQVVEGLAPFMKELEAVSKGRVKFVHYTSGQLGKQNDMLELLKSGVADMAYIGPSYFSGKMPLSGVFELPHAYPSSAIGSEAYWQMSVNGILAKEEWGKHNVYPVLAMAYAPYEIFNSKKNGRLPADFKGMKLRTAGGTQDLAVRAFGAVSIFRTPQELYESAQRGVVDGAVFPVEAIASYKLDEVFKYATQGANVTGFVMAYAVNGKTWNALPDDIKKIFLKVGLDQTRKFGKTADLKSKELYAQYEKAGMQVAVLTPQEKTAWVQATASVQNQWVENLEKRKLPGKRVFEDYKKYMDSLKK